MAYVGVEFMESGSVGLVHCSWLTPLKREVFWPPYKTTNLFNKALTNAEEPNQAQWKLFHIKRSFFECDDIEKAKKKLKKCEETSDIQSSESEDIKKRNRVIKRKCISECSSSDEEEITNLKLLPRPPIFPSLSKGSTSKSAGESSSQVVVDKLPTNDSPGLALQSTPLSSGIHLNGRNAPNSAYPDSLEKVFQEIRKLREEVKEIKGLLKQSRNAVSSSLPSDIPVEFPLKHVADMQKLEDYLNDQDNQNNLASYFCALGGTGTTAHVNRILRFTMTNSLAIQYNFAGQRSVKQAFGSTKLKSVIISALQLKYRAITQVEVENAIKIWLKHAKQRLEKSNSDRNN